MDMDKVRRIIFQFLPMILIFLFLKSPKKFAQLSNGVLGKLLAVIIILFYVSIDKIYGVFVCVLIIFYYQSDFMEKMCEGFEDGTPTPEPTKGVTLGPMIDLSNVEIPKDGNILYGPDLEKSQETFENLEDAYPEMDEDKATTEKEEKFCKVHCKNGHLINKGQVVSPEMAEHVYPIESKNHCNICDPTCKFKVIENRFVGKTQEK